MKLTKKQTPLLQVGKEYTFTVNPENQHHGKKKACVTEKDKDRDVLINNQWKKLLQEFSINSIEFILQMEASEPVRGNRDPDKAVSRLHYHGKIFFTTRDSLRWFLMYGTAILSKICSYEIDELNDPELWEEYCNKQSFLEWPRLRTFKYSGVPSPAPVQRELPSTKGRKQKKVPKEHCEDLSNELSRLRRNEAR